MADIPITDQLTDERVAIMADEYLPRIYEQVAMKSMLLNTFEMSPYKESRNGGARIRVPLQYGKNTSFETFGKGSTFEPEVVPTLMFGYYNFKQGAGNVYIDWVEERETAPNGEVSITLMEARVNDLISGTREAMTRMLWAAQIGNENQDMNGLQLLIPNDPRTGVLAGLDRASHIWWRHCYWDDNVSGYQYGQPPHDITLGVPVDVGAFGAFTGGGAGSRGYSNCLKRMGTILDNCSEGESLSDYVIITDRLTYEQYTDMPQHMGAITVNYSQDENVVRWNFGGALFRGVPILRDSVYMGAPTGEMRIINKQYMKLITDSGAWFTWSEERKPFNQFAKARYLLLRGQLVLLNPRKHGSLQGITAWAS